MRKALTHSWRQKQTAAIVVLLALFSIQSIFDPAHAQTLSSAREALTKKIEDYAQKNVTQNRPQETTDVLIQLFGDEATTAGVSHTEVVNIYGEAYQAAKPTGPGWQQFLPNVGWGIAIVLFLLLFIRDAVRDFFKKKLSTLADKTWNRAAGYRIFRRKALHVYRVALIEKYHQLTIPFRPERPLDMRQVYVPLKVQGQYDTNEFDLYTILPQHKRFMIVGAPGSGKSMQLKHLALSYAEGRVASLLPERPTAILLELHRLNADEKSLEAWLVHVLRLNDFPHADNFVRSGLQRGILLVLFDGLDEVDSQRRSHVVQKIKDFVDEYDQCRVILPHSRSQFYDSAINELLRKWKTEYNRYSAPQKRRVLQHLALCNHDASTKQQQDPRSMDYPTVMQQVKEILPKVNLEDQDTEPLVNEIVERSGLLLRIDGGEKYQFAHLTLQEFLAADALKDDAARLFARFRAHPDTWREPVKLWCGLDHDATLLIQKVYQTEPTMALDCLADAQQVDPDIADTILADFQARLPEQNDTIVRGLALVAADPGPRGTAVFGFLVEALTTDTPPVTQRAAVRALSLTNLPKAAQLLGEQYDRLPDVQSALITIGDLAVPTLLHLIKEGHREAYGDLQAIGTPQAAHALVSLLWDRNKTKPVYRPLSLGSPLCSGTGQWKQFLLPLSG